MINPSSCALRYITNQTKHDRVYVRYNPYFILPRHRCNGPLLIQPSRLVSHTISWVNQRLHRLGRTLSRPLLPYTGMVRSRVDSQVILACVTADLLIICVHMLIGQQRLADHTKDWEHNNPRMHFLGQTKLLNQKIQLKLRNLIIKLWTWTPILSHLFRSTVALHCHFDELTTSINSYEEWWCV